MSRNELFATTEPVFEMPGALPFERGHGSAGRSMAEPPMALMGVAFDNITTAETVATIEKMIQSREPHYVVTANVDFLVQARRDVELHRILLDAHLVLCDGTPLLWVSRWLGNPLPERVAGADLVPLLIKRAAQTGHRIFFLGGAPSVAAKAVANLQAKYPDLVIAGHYSPPFRPLLEMDHTEITRRIREAKPDLLFVSFGCPKAEKWCSMNYRMLGVPVAIGVGATIDFLAGTVRRAPRWMQRTGTEWIFRMAQEPRRLMRRYTTGIWHFTTGVMAQWCCLHFHRRKIGARQCRATFEERVASLHLTPPPRLDVRAVQRDGALWEKAATDGRHCLLDMSGVNVLDSSGVGLLISLHKRLRQSGRQLVLIGASQVVRRVLRRMRLQDYFTTARNEDMVWQRIKARSAEGALVKFNRWNNQLEWRGEITVENAERIGQATVEQWRSNPVPQPWVIDISLVRFIDSRGAELIARLAAFAESAGCSLNFTGARPAVRDVLRRSKMESLLLKNK